MRVGIIGGGITGLSCAHYLVRRGVRPIVFESSRKLRSWGAHGTGEYGLDPFPIGLRRSDTAICGLINDLGLTSLLHWQRTPCAVHAEGEFHSLSGLRDLLRYTPLAPLQRLRAAAATYASTLLRAYARPLDSVSAREWFRRTCGAATYDRLWRRVLAARFGSAHVDDMPAYLAWQSLREELLGSHEVTGTLRGGFGVLCEALASSVTQGGGEIHTDTAVEAIESDGPGVRVDVGHGRIELDAVIAAIPLPQLSPLVVGELAEPLAKPLCATRSQEISSLRVKLRGRSPISGYFRVLMLDSQAPFPTVIDASSLLPDAVRRDSSLLYMVRLGAGAPSAGGPRTSGDRPATDRRRVEIDGHAHTREAFETLRRIDPALCPSRIEETHLFRWRSPEPVWPVDALRRPIPPRLGKSGLHVCTAAQAYPRGATPEAAVMLARDCVGRVLRETA